MFIRKPKDVKSSEITDQKTYLNRRTFMRSAVLAGTATASTLLYRALNPPPPETVPGVKLSTVPQGSDQQAIQEGYKVQDALTPLEEITTYNNFYEFITPKVGVAYAAKGVVTKPWTVSVFGLVNKPRTFDLDELLKFPLEERVYRLRCVEGWSMVIPWIGFPLNKILEKVEPTSDAKYVAFQTLLDPNRMPLQRTGVLEWPYVEGL